jgi:hypothetical protein
MTCDEPHLMPNEKMQLIQWTERPTGALMAAGSLWPLVITYEVWGGSRRLYRIDYQGE